MKRITMSNTLQKRLKIVGLKQEQQGFSLIEILVTVVIISVGLLGTAALNLVSLRNSSTALIRSQASVLAEDITDRMRANRPVAVGPAFGYNVANSTATPTDPQALTDVTEWRALLAQSLPNGAGTISVVARIATITISWTEREAGTAAAAGTQSFTIATEI